MMSALFKQKVIVIPILLIGVGILLVILLKPDPKVSNEQADSALTLRNVEGETRNPNSELSKVNPEESNPLLVQAGLPYENDQYAITYRFDQQKPSGVVLIVIDKTNTGAVSVDVRAATARYLNDRNIPLNSVTIEYKTR